MRLRPVANASLALAAALIATSCSKGVSEKDSNEGRPVPAAAPESQKAKPHAVGPALRDLTAEEKALLAALPPGSPQELLVVRPGGVVERMATTAGALESVAREVRERDPEAAVVPDFKVELRRPADPAFRVDKQLLLSGKEEFDLAAWRKTYPKADGRGVRIGVVDDGVALGRPGLLETSGGESKIAASVNVSPQWHLPLRPGGTCGAKSVSSKASKEWSIAPGVLPERDARLRVPFDLTPCGINPELAGRSRGCTDWNGLFPEAGVRAVDGVLRVPALYVEYAPEGGASSPSRYLLVDVDGDGAITEEERVRSLPREDASESGIPLVDGSVLGFDVHKTSLLREPAAGGLDNPRVTDACAAGEAPEETLTLHVPQRGDDFGSHGEGVASIAAGFDVAGQGFDGVAPGARVVDVHFGDPVGGRFYTLSEVGRALRIAGDSSEIVNLSYSLFFQSPGAQVAMGRYLEALLGETSALYFFSAGNNGPGRGSMNRSLTYPTSGIAVGAYLSPAMAQSTFGSARAAGGVVSYSSRGPGIDGGSGPAVLAPLAGIVAGTADEGFGPFSGTSSATPALAGFAARVLSQARIEGLPWDRDALRAAITASAEPLEGVAFVDQGFGMPKLGRAFAIYKERVQGRKQAPVFDVDGGLGSLGVKRKGVYVRGEQDRADLYAFALTPVFSSGWSETDRADYSETLVLRSDADWVSFPRTVFASRSGTSVQMAIDWDALEGRTGEELAHVEAREADSGALRAVIPVTVILSGATRGESVRVVGVKPNDVSRVFLQKPAWATHLVVARETTEASQTLCGRAAVYSPVGVRMASPAGGTWGSAQGVRSESAFETRASGVYEITVEGRASHTLCPRDQKVRVRAKWLQLTVVPESVTVASAAPGTASGAPVDHTLRLRVESRVAPGLAGTIELSQPAVERTVELRPSTRAAFEWEGGAVDLSRFDRLSVALEEGDAVRLAALRGYPRLDLALRPTRGNPWPVVVPLSAGSDPSAPLALGSLGLSESEIKKVKPIVSAFDFGLGGGYAPAGAVRVRMRGYEKDAPAVNVLLPSASLRPGNPAILEGAFAAPVEAIAGRSLACGFRPAGFGVTVSCGSVLLP